MGLPKDPNIPKCSKFIEKDLITHLVKAMMNAVHIMLGLYWKTFWKDRFKPQTPNAFIYKDNVFFKSEF